MRLLLWDIDGTLLRAGAHARDVFATAVAHVVGRHPGEHGVMMGGKTDPQIALEIMSSMAVAHEVAQGHVPAVLDRLQAELAAGTALLRQHGRVLPGVRELLQRLAATPDVAQTVLTGNIAANAAGKLAVFELDGLLDLRIGAYGSDAVDRRELVPIAVQRLHDLRGADPDAVWVIGDTPHDLTCARAGGAHCLLVATGTYPYETLVDLGADEVLADLTDVEAVAALLLG